MKSEFDKQLEKGLSALVDFAPSDSFWDGMEEQLNFSDQLDTCVAELPQFTPSDEVWNRVEKRLNWAERKQSREARLWRKYATSIMVAASLAFIIVRTILNHSETNNLWIETEVQSVSVLAPTNLSDNQIMIQVEDLCKKETKVCQSEQFEEKVQLYKELDEELLELKSAIQMIGESPEMIQSMNKIIEMKSDTAHELLGMLTS